MESTHHEEERKVDSEFTQKWLLLGLHIGSSWSADLAKHLNASDGEGLLLIIDGLDEYTKEIPCGLSCKQQVSYDSAIGINFR